MSEVLVTESKQTPEAETHQQILRIKEKLGARALVGVRESYRKRLDTGEQPDPQAVEVYSGDNVLGLKTGQEHSTDTTSALDRAGEGQVTLDSKGQVTRMSRRLSDGGLSAASVEVTASPAPLEGSTLQRQEVTGGSRRDYENSSVFGDDPTTRSEAAGMLYDLKKGIDEHGARRMRT
jgi:hypothetical protein